MMRRVALVWAGLLCCLLLELGLMLLGAGAAAPLIGLVMSAIVIAVPMELLTAPNPARIFAMAGLFWLVVILFGLGTLDPLTRHDAPAPIVLR